MTPELGVCYYPEQWDEAMWQSDAARMVEAGITWVRIAEFSWSRMEASPGVLSFDWLDRAIETLAQAGLKIIMCTPTATPPRWMIDKHPDILAVDAEGRARKFGSRRHYCFSHQGFLEECRRITRILGERYGRDPRIFAWQLDNEYGCHDTIVSYSDAARAGFQGWLTETYGDTDALNAAWGNVFWSMEYTSIDQVDLPNLTVTEPNPSHVMAFRRFSSDQVVAFNRAQAEILRACTDTPLIHNYMGRVLEFDHFAVGADLDIASWDSYPIGFLSDRLEGDEAHKMTYLQQGDPDMQAFHHDLYRTVGRGRWWVMEQQPGPVNWAPYNPAPLPGMVRLWSWEAFAHGAEVVSYFRWRQAPVAQEQMHAGLLRPNDRPAPGMDEAIQVGHEIKALGDISQNQADVALIFDYASDWAWHTMPQGADFDYFRLMFSAYKTLRAAGLSIDILPSTARDFSGYKAVLAPGLANTDPDLYAALKTSEAVVLLGPRTAMVTDELSIPDRTPDIDGLTLDIPFSESLPPAHTRAVEGGGAVAHWMEQLCDATQILLHTTQGAPVMSAHDNLWYLGGWPDTVLWTRIVDMLAQKTNLTTRSMPSGLRQRQAGAYTFVFNYHNETQTLDGHSLAPASVALWRGEERLW